MGQLGDGTNTNKNTPVQIGTGTNWASVSAGGNHTLAIMGLLSPTLSSPVNGAEDQKISLTLAWNSVISASSYDIQVSTDSTFATTFVSANTINTQFDVSGLSKTTKYYWRVRANSDGSESNWSEIWSFTTKLQGTFLYAWGNNFFVQLGDGTNINKTSPVRIGTGSDWASVSSAQYHSIAIKRDDTPFVWGDNTNGQLGDGTNTAKNAPTMLGEDVKFKSLSSGSLHTVVILENGTLYSWGNNLYGQLGDGTNTNKNSPIQVGTSANWVSVSSGVSHTVAIKSDGTLWAWGKNEDGQLGDGTYTDKNSQVKIGSDTNWVSVSTGGYNTVAIKSDGTLWAWGRNSSVNLATAQILIKTALLELEHPQTGYQFPLV